MGEPLRDTADSAFLQAFNDAVEIRRLMQKLDRQERMAVAEVLPDEPAVA